MAKNYDPKKFILVFNGVQFRAFHTGTMIEVSRIGDTYTDEVGGDGEVVRTKSHDKRATITATLQYASEVNDLLSAFQAIGEDDDNVDGDVGECFLRDLNGTTVGISEQAWIVKPPDITVATEHTGRAWVIRAAKWRIFTGGARR